MAQARQTRRPAFMHQRRVLLRVDWRANPDNALKRAIEVARTGVFAIGRGKLPGPGLCTPCRVRLDATGEIGSGSPGSDDGADIVLPSTEAAPVSERMMHRRRYSAKRCRLSFV